MWVEVAKAKDLKPEAAKTVRAGDHVLALVSTPRGLFAMDNACPHEQGPLGEGTVQGTVVSCPLHAWQFDCTTGACLTERRNPVKTYPVRVDGGAVLVEIPDIQAVAASSSAGEWVAVADAAALKPGTVRKVTVGGRHLALGSTADGVFALDDACAHEGASLSEGSLDRSTLTCPLHSWQFDCSTGQCLTTPGKQQARHDVRIEGGQVQVRLNPGAAPSEPAGEAPQFSPVEQWKRAKHGFDVWPDVLRYADQKTPMADIDAADLERMKWYGYFHRKTNDINHYMCRIRIPGCEMTSEQARAIAFVAYRSGYSIVDFTTRGNVQVQGLTVEELPGVRSALEAVGLTSRQTGHDNVRNVTSHPYSGIDPREILDTRSLARAIQELVVDNREFSDLPRKFNVAMTGRPEAPGHLWTQDLSFVAALTAVGEPAFHVLVGGKQGQSPHLAQRLPVLIAPEDVVPFTAALLRAFRELGLRHNRTEVRLHYVIERIGLERLLGEVETRLGRQLTRSLAPPPIPEREESTVGWFPQKQPGKWALGVCIPVGRLTWEELEGLAVVAREYGSGRLRTTTNQNVVIPDIPAPARESVSHAVARYGLTHEPDTVTKNLVSCTGKQFCNLAVTETKGYALRLIDELRRRKVQLHNITLNMSGCPSSCANSYTADIGLKGTKIRRRLRVVDAFDVYLAGGVGETVQLGLLYRKAVPFDELAHVLEGVIREFYLHRKHGDNFAQYWRRELSGTAKAPQPDELPTWGCTGCGYRQISADPPAYCPNCAAIRIKFEPVSPEDPAPPKPKASRAAPAPASGAAAAPSARLSAPPAVPAAAAKPASTGKRVVIVGGSIAAHTAAQMVRTLDPDALVTMAMDEPAYYNRLNLTRYLAGEVARDQLFEFGTDWYAQHRIDRIAEARVIAVDPLARSIATQQGQEVGYDACILAHGSTATVPPFHRPDLPGVHLLRTLADADAILEGIRPGTRVVVIGGGVLALEAASGVAWRGASVHVLEQMPRLMPRQLDGPAAELLARHAVQKGITATTGAAVEALEGTKRVTGVRLADRRVFPADRVLISTGIAPNVEWVKRSGVQCGRGILVDDRMQTSAPAVFAAGDVVEWRGQVIGLWNPAVEQARVAAASALGRTASYGSAPPVTILKCLGLPLVSIGEIPSQPELESGDGTVHASENVYRRTFERRGHTVGAILVGTLEGMGSLRKAVEEGWKIAAQQAPPAPAGPVRAVS